LVNRDIHSLRKILMTITQKIRYYLIKAIFVRFTTKLLALYKKLLTTYLSKNLQTNKFKLFTSVLSTTTFHDTSFNITPLIILTPFEDEKASTSAV